MKRLNRMLLAAGCLVLLIVSWAVVIGAKSDTDKQAELIAQAEAYINDKIYINSVPLLEEAIKYNTPQTITAENMLKGVYLELIDQRGYRNKYIGLLEKQIKKEDATPDMFIELANFYFNNSKLKDALTVLNQGINKTGSEEIITLYENNRYSYRLGRSTYDDVTAIFNKTIAVQVDNLWGLGKYDGSLIIPCEYEKISTFNNDRAIVQKDGEIYAVDSNNNRLALLKEKVLDFGNYSGGRITLEMEDGWRRASGDFEIGSMVFEKIGTYSNGYAAAKQNGKWGLIDLSSDWLVPAEYDEIIMDELGRSFAQDAVFVRDGDSIKLIVKGELKPDNYEDARPFSDEGFAAVKQNGKWGFIDTAGEVRIGFQFDDALSFGQHLAAVKQGGLWGYINLFGKMVIEPVFIEAKSFSNGGVPVLTEQGWQFITLLEYEEGAGL